MPIALALAMRRQLACSAHSSLTSRANRHLWCSWLCRLRRVSLRFDIRIAAWASGRWDHGCRARVRHGWPDRHVRIEARGRADHALGPTQPLTQAFARRGRAVERGSWRGSSGVLLSGVGSVGPAFGRETTGVLRPATIATTLRTSTRPREADVIPLSPAQRASSEASGSTAHPADSRARAQAQPAFGPVRHPRLIDDLFEEALETAVVRGDRGLCGKHTGEMTQIDGA